MAQGGREGVDEGMFPVTHSLLFQKVFQKYFVLTVPPSSCFSSACLRPLERSFLIACSSSNNIELIYFKGALSRTFFGFFVKRHQNYD